MNRNLELMQSLSTLEFNGKMNGLEGLFQKIEDLDPLPGGAKANKNGGTITGLQLGTENAHAVRQGRAMVVDFCVDEGQGAEEIG